MGCCINDLKDKDVINITDAKKLGCVIDVEVDVCKGRLLAIIVPGEPRGLIFGRRDELRIPWERIVKIGNDTILVDLGNRCCEQIKSDKPKNL
ncbi:MAG: YlmC/YmxH family sporulation protein [Clostridia bacterium]|nr:YlmC/YmxH family sporulation protein [Clostridia bacterium]